MDHLTSLSPEQIKVYWDMAFPLVSGMLMAAAILVLGWIASKWANRAVLRTGEKSKVDEALKRFLASIAQYTVLAAAVIAALGRVGIETTSLVAVFASAGLAVGLALQGSLSNFASGVMILFFRPFALGDRVIAGGEMGTVDDIGLFATTLLTPDNHTVILPNAAVIGGTITNFTKQGTLRAVISAGVAYGADLEAVEAALIDACVACDLVLAEPEPTVAFVDMAASSLNFDVMPWCKAGDLIKMRHTVRRNIYVELTRRGIEIPFNQIVIHHAPATE